MISKPQRMCIICKGRYLQYELIRLQTYSRSIVNYSGIGRSFYICKVCKDLDKTPKIIVSRFKLDKELVSKNFKEIVLNAKNSC